MICCAPAVFNHGRSKIGRIVETYNSNSFGRVNPRKTPSSNRLTADREMNV